MGKTKLVEITEKIINYSPTYETITFYNPNGGYNKWESNYDFDKEYYIKSDSRRLPRHLKGFFVRLKPVYTFFESVENTDKWSVYPVLRKPVANPVYTVFQIVKRGWTLEHIEDDSKLNKLHHFFNDTDYFATIPKINELNHWDNGVVTANNTQLLVSYNETKETTFKKDHSIDFTYVKDWDKFTIDTKNLFNGEDILTLSDKLRHDWKGAHLDRD